MTRRLVDERRMPVWLRIVARLIAILIAASMLLAVALVTLVLVVLALVWIDGGAW